MSPSNEVHDSVVNSILAMNDKEKMLFDNLVFYRLSLAMDV